MPFAVTLVLDSATAGRLAAMRRQIAEQIASADPGQSEYAPHITLGVHPDDAPIDDVQRALQKLAAEWKPLPLSFCGFGIFPGPPPTLRAAPVVTSSLLARHVELRAALSEVTPHEHFESDAWVPHVTVSATLSDPAEALRVLLAMWRPLSGQLERLHLVHFPPVEVLRSHTLSF
ncbi:MAG: 2'-5' RNA ligase family protein [Acetobacteraceae bacterium]